MDLNSFQLFPPVNSYFMLIPISYVYNWFVSVFSIKPISMSSIPSVLNFYPWLNAKVVPDFLFNFLIKLPLLVSDILATLLLYRIVNKLTGKKGLAEKAALSLVFESIFDMDICSVGNVGFDGCNVLIAFSLFSHQQKNNTFRGLVLLLELSQNCTQRCFCCL